MHIRHPPYKSQCFSGNGEAESASVPAIGKILNLNLRIHESNRSPSYDFGFIRGEQTRQRTVRESDYQSIPPIPRVRLYRPPRRWRSRWRRPRRRPKSVCVKTNPCLTISASMAEEPRPPALLGTILTCSPLQPQARAISSASARHTPASPCCRPSARLAPLPELPPNKSLTPA